MGRSPQGTEIVEFLKSQGLFEGLRTEELRRVAERLRPVQVRKGAFLFQQGLQADSIHFLYEGQARVLQMSPEGRERVLHLVLAGDMVGAVPFFDRKPYPCTVVADTDCVFLALSRDDFRALVREHVEVAFGIMGAMARRLRRMVGLVEEMTFHDTRHRLWHYLLERAGGEPDAFPVRARNLPTKERIAAAIGTVREVVSRNLSRLAREGYVRLEGRDAILLKPLPESDSE